MHSLAINSLGKSKCSMLTVAFLFAATVFAVRTFAAQQLQKGVSVQLPVTTAAAPMPDADSRGAWIVTVTADGSVYFGVDPVNPSGLADAMKSRPHRREQKLYLKADARAQFADVEHVLEVVRAASFDTTVLLTSQPGRPASETIVPPQGLEVLLTPPPSSPEPPTVVQVTAAVEQEPTVRVDRRQIPPANLQNLLTLLFQNRPEKMVIVKTEGPLSFAHVAHVIDVCRSAGARVLLATPPV
jgi:biopolymer transport protein ExbD